VGKQMDGHPPLCSAEAPAAFQSTSTCFGRDDGLISDKLKSLQVCNFDEKEKRAGLFVVVVVTEAIGLICRYCISINGE